MANGKLRSNISFIIRIIRKKTLEAGALAALLPAFTSPIIAHAAGAKEAKSLAEVSIAQADSNEQQERAVDLVALSSQDLAISRLTGMLKKYRNTSQEAVFLSKLADIQQQRAAMIFRVAHGNAAHSKKALDLTRHHKALADSIATLDRLISSYPNFEEIAHAYFLRGKSYEDIEKKAEAGKDYLHLVQNFPNADDATPAYMSLAEFAIEANDHVRAITFLKEVEKKPEDPHYPFALYKLAWSHYNLKKIPESLGYAERQIAYYNERASKMEAEIIGGSDSALKENMLLDLTIFYFEGYEQQLSSYSIKEALGYFKKLDKGPTLGRMLLRFAKLIRSHSHEADLVAWKNLVLGSESAYPESLDVVILTYEYQLNNQHYPKVVDCAHDMVKLFAQHKMFESFPKAQKQLLDTAEGLQTMIVKNKGASEVGTYSKILAEIYDSFTHVVEDIDPRIPRVHYNLAETLFTIKDFMGATEHYRWVVDHGKWEIKPVALTKIKAKQAPPDTSATVPDSSLKAIASRYEVLQSRHFIPKELSAAVIPTQDPSALEPLLAQWVEWIDAHTAHVDDETTQNFAFEANRALYAQGHILRALDRMAKFSLRHPQSQYAVSQASLVLDSYIASANWKKTHDLATEFMEVPEWKKGEFSKKLLAVASDAFYKQLEIKFHARDYKGTLEGCDEFLKQYATSARLGDILALAGSSALENIERKRADTYFSRLISEVPANSNVPMALLARAALREDKYLFAQAAHDYRAYVMRLAPDKSSDPKQLLALRKKALALSWLSSDQAELRTALADKSLCIDELAKECEKFSILNLIAAATQTPGGLVDEKSTQEAFEKARPDAAGETRSLWAILALEGTRYLTFRDRLLMVRHAVTGWEQLDPLVKFAMVPRLSQSLAQSFKLNRIALKDVAPLRAHEKWITRRVEVIREMENAATLVMKLPWARIRAETLNEIAGIYLDLSRGLAALPAPKDLSTADLTAYEDTIRKITMPFEEKGQDMRAKAFEIASRFAIEEESFASIADPFFAENPSQAKSLKGDKPDLNARAPEPLTMALLAKIDTKGGWPDIIRGTGPVIEVLSSENPALYIKTLWGRAIQAHRLQQIAFFLQEAQEKALIQAGVMGSVKAISMVVSGARGEGFAELEDARRDLAPEARNLVTTLLASFYKNSFARDKFNALLKDLKNAKAEKPDGLAGNP